MYIYDVALCIAAKRESINLDGIVGVLDPDKSGIIRLSSIHQFGKELTDYKVIESQSSGIDDVGDHQEETVHIKSPLELKDRSGTKSNGNRFKFNQNLSPNLSNKPTLSSGESKNSEIMSVLPDDNVASSDSELDFNKVIPSM